MQERRRSSPTTGFHAPPLNDRESPDYIPESQMTSADPELPRIRVKAAVLAHFDIQPRGLRLGAIGVEDHGARVRRQRNVRSGCFVASADLSRLLGGVLHVCQTTELPLRVAGSF